jgi:hypothetical protein
MLMCKISKSLQQTDCQSGIIFSFHAIDFPINTLIKQWVLILNTQFIPGFTNVIADLISRGNFQKFKKLAPLADIFPTSVPETFWKLLDHNV